MFFTMHEQFLSINKLSSNFPFYKISRVSIEFPSKTYNRTSDTMHFQTILFTLAAISLSLVCSAPIPTNEATKTPLSADIPEAHEEPVREVEVTSDDDSIATPSASATDVAANSDDEAEECPICSEEMSSEPVVS
jgi:hypothetical protein